MHKTTAYVRQKANIFSGHMIHSCLWESVESLLGLGMLYVITPSQKIIREQLTANEEEVGREIPGLMTLKSG